MIEKEFLFKDFSQGGKAIVTLNENSLTITRPGIMAKLAHGATGEKTIMYNQITSVQYKKAGFSRGYIQFVVAGSREARSGAIFGEKDENIIYFASGFNNDDVNNACEIIKKTIEQYNANLTKGTMTVVKHEDDHYDKLIKLKQLLDINAITQEEFDKEKQKLLK